MHLFRSAVVVGFVLLLASCAAPGVGRKTVTGKAPTAQDEEQRRQEIVRWYWETYGQDSPYEQLKREEEERKRQERIKWYWETYGKDSPYYKK